jgi:hypothetical protein
LLLTDTPTIQTYHDLLIDELTAVSRAQLEAQLRRRGLRFGERPPCTVLRPRFIPGVGGPGFDRASHRRFPFGVATQTPGRWTTWCGR